MVSLWFSAQIRLLSLVWNTHITSCAGCARRAGGARILGASGCKSANEGGHSFGFVMSPTSLGHQGKIRVSSFHNFGKLGSEIRGSSCGLDASEFSVGMSWLTRELTRIRD